jgi:hypothetical protein
MPRGGGAGVHAHPAARAAVARGTRHRGRAVPGLRHGWCLRRRRTARGVPEVCRRGAGVVHRHARLHHARHGPHPQAQGLRRTPPRQASLSVRDWCRLIVPSLLPLHLLHA